MRFPVSLSLSFVAVAAMSVGYAARGYAQSTTNDTSGPQPTANGTYVVVDPLANVKYDERFDASLGAAYGHIKAGPPPLEQGANLGGLDLSASYWFSRRWAAEGTGRAYLGTSGAGVNDLSINGPFVAEYVFAGGPEWLGPHNKHAALIAHALVGGAYGNFERDLRGNSPSAVEFFNDQISLAALIGGHIELNRSARWVVRITPDAKYTRYSINYGNRDTYPYWNFALSAGVEYKFKKKR